MRPEGKIQSSILCFVTLEMIASPSGPELAYSVFVEQPTPSLSSPPPPTVNLLIILRNHNTTFYKLDRSQTIRDCCTRPVQAQVLHLQGSESRPHAGHSFRAYCRCKIEAVTSSAATDY
ncbi:hypothetical protein KIL84_014013 [Mauremys mutica]|uniref:Uncharacterized protein n=1 Tax=Mauremys mutica TaxID=74926 RepID=A0A9D4ASP0_9SAUR|nr:hypothetical protein KIL84_014013 [Mauremys mutica]